MKRRAFFLTTVILPLLIIGFSLNYEMKKRATQASQAMELRLFNVCSQGAESSRDYKASKELTNSVCGCFSKTVIRHKSISVASIISDPDMVKAILQDCSRRVTVR